MFKKPVAYDLILQDGTHKVNRSELDKVQSPVCHSLKLTFIHYIPYLGTLRRNLWAKKHGASLTDSIFD